MWLAESSHHQLLITWFTTCMVHRVQLSRVRAALEGASNAASMRLAKSSPRVLQVIHCEMCIVCFVCMVKRASFEGDLREI